MRTHHLIIGCLSLAWIAVDALLAAVLVAWEVPWPHWIGVVAWGCAFGQTTCLAAWMVWGNWNIAIRATVGVAVMYAMAYITSLSTLGTAGLSLWFTAQFMFVFFTLTILIPCRAAGVKIVTSDPVPDSVETKPTLQFTILSLLSAMTVVAVVLAGLGRTETNIPDLISAGIFFATIATFTSSVFWATLTFRRQFAVALVAIPIAALVGVLLTFIQISPSQRGQLITACIAMAMATFASASVLRIAGCRVERSS